MFRFGKVEMRFGRIPVCICLLALLLCSCSDSNQKNGTVGFDLYGVYRLGEQVAGDSSIVIADNRHYVFRPEFYYMFVTNRDDTKGVPSISGRARYSEEAVASTEFSDLGFADLEIYTNIDFANTSVKKYTIRATEADRGDKLYLVDGNLWIYFMYGQKPVIYKLEKVLNSVLEEIAGLSYDEGLDAKEEEYHVEGA